MRTVEQKIKGELIDLFEKTTNLIKLASDDTYRIEFDENYQPWYTRAIKIVGAVIPGKLQEFLNCYLIDREGQPINADNYAIEDYVEGNAPPRDDGGNALWDHNAVIKTGILNQIEILNSVTTRIDSIHQYVTKHLSPELQDAELQDAELQDAELQDAELQDKELEASSQLLTRSPRAAGVLAVVALERHLQRVATNHKIPLPKKVPTISDLNKPLRDKDVYGILTWSKIQLFDNLRNKCSHQTGSEPTEDEVRDLIDGVNRIIKNIF